MAADLKSLPILRNDRLIFEDTVSAPRPGAIVPCLLCMKPFLMGFFIGEPDQICPECEKTYADTAKVICVRCRPQVTICRLVPKILDNGFYIRPRSILHSNRCNVCCPGISESSIIEIEAWERTRRPGKIIITR
jgi:hypothetical protein